MTKDKTQVSVFTVCITIAFSIVLTSTHVSAQSDETNNCLAIEDNIKRLSCFDKLYTDKSKNDKIKDNVSQESASTNRKPPQPEMDEIDKRAQALMTKANKSDDPFSSSTPRISAKNNQKINESDDSFGAESMSSSNANEVNEIQTQITVLVEDAYGYATITLSNKQVWRQTEIARYTLKKGDMVIIEKGVFNSYYLSKTDNNRRIRVKRIK